jgi:hypothetical protein
VRWAAPGWADCEAVPELRAGAEALSIVLTRQAVRRQPSSRWSCTRSSSPSGWRPVATQLDRVLAEGYTSRSYRRHLHRRGIKATIPGRTDQDASGVKVSLWTTDLNTLLIALP